MKSKALIKLNRLFPPVTHPFNLRKDGGQKYSEWEFERGEDTIKRYIDTSCVRDTDDMLKGKHILDVGSGACGKSVYYLTRGASHVSAIDIIADYKAEAEELAERCGVRDRFEYTVGDAACMPFEDNSFDAVIMNDAMEHVQAPERVLDEIYRVLRPGGRLYVNFPPYFHPYGAHLTDAIAIPWVHLFFNEDTLIRAYKTLVSSLPDANARVSFRISPDENGKEYLSYINRMTVKRFNNICKSAKLTRVYYRELPLRPFLTPLAKLPLTKEAFIRCVVCVLEKTGGVR